MSKSKRQWIQLDNTNSDALTSEFIPYQLNDPTTIKIKIDNKLDADATAVNSDKLGGKSLSGIPHSVATTSYTGTDNYGDYTKFATITLTAQHQDKTLSLLVFNDSGSGTHDSVTTLNIRVKQDAEIGSNPGVSIKPYYHGQKLNDFAYHIVQNSPTVIIDFYIKVLRNSSNFHFLQQVASGNGTLQFHSNQPFTSYFSGMVDIASKKIWTEDNQGSGSGMNADMVDGEHASDIVSKARVENVLTGNITSHTHTIKHNVVLQCIGTVTTTGDKYPELLCPCNGTIKKMSYRCESGSGAVALIVNGSTYQSVSVSTSWSSYTGDLSVLSGQVLKLNVGSTSSLKNAVFQIEIEGIE